MAKFYATTKNDVSNREIEHMIRVRKLAAECMVLLENDGVLPFKKKIGNIALYGNGARKTIKGGTGSGDVNSRSVVNIEQGLEAVGYTVTSKKWIERYEKIYHNAFTQYWTKLEKDAKEVGVPAFALRMSNPFSEPPLPMVKESDVESADTNTAIYVLARNSGEGADRSEKEGDYLLTEDEKSIIIYLSEKFEQFIVLLNVGGVIDTKVLKSIPGINALVLISQSGNIGGYAVADMLVGATIPSGKLTATWAENYNEYSSSEGFSSNDGNTDDEYYTEGIFTGYRYFDTFNITPSYCFGYGLALTTFQIQVEDVKADSNEVTVAVKVTNTGSENPGREVVQIYSSAPQEHLEKPYQELSAFGKTSMLKPGDSETLIISFKTTSMASYSEEKSAWIMEAGSYYIRVGNSSRSTKVVAKINLDKEVMTEKVMNLFKDENPVKDMSISGIQSYSYDGEVSEKEGAPVITLSSVDFSCNIIEYHPANDALIDMNANHKITMDEVISGKYTLDELTAQLTVEEMANLCCGTAKGLEIMSAVGSSSITVPGAAGDTTTIMKEDRNINEVILADGPAGLRLVPHFVASDDGVILSESSAFTTEGKDIRKVGEEIEGTHYYQYCTAIPIATLLASSWDMELIEECGYIVGKEMQEMHVTLWLAPGMNNHRNPLCGRNFEYYSEDPLLSGMCAAASTKGAQSIAGIGTTIKHFAANNQENNRFLSCSHVSERALREIYIKSFEIAIKTAQPMSIMSSYNLLNGIHTANSRDLLTTVARNEWGFAGIVMTDWFTTQNMDMLFGGVGKKNKYDISSPTMCIYAGNDLIMPGSDNDIDSIIAGVQSGELNLGDLQACAKHILNIIMRSHQYKGAKPYSEQFTELPYAVNVKKQ
ncbi:beta-glucosidase [Alkalibaculum sp. M08DMB]|uniref:Beta-glucosidase n=1 Tax=Alkalibaculum sporogenes TaxID=2655001 RepID=A0A6A7K8Y3_9FIRM|nr:glycoside hydrolase family 3 protein [Alkalibaculum sporogenes]MPW25852.1 beta-glucosidase [Alkalibaculum sporogenes]